MGGKIKSLFIEALIGLMAIIFVLFAIAAFSEKSWLSGVLFLSSAGLPLPYIRKRILVGLNRPRNIGLIMLCVLIVGVSIMEEDTYNAQAAKTKALNEKIIADAHSEFQIDPDKVKREITELIEKKDYNWAKRKAERLLNTGDSEIRQLYDTAVTESTKITMAEQEKTRKAMEESQKAIQENQTRTIRALDACKHEIADFLNAHGAGSIPDVQNWGSDNEFVFGWPRGTFQITTVFGYIDLSASCVGSLYPLKVESLSVNGKTVILNGQKM